MAFEALLNPSLDASICKVAHADFSESLTSESRANECKNGDWSNKCYRCGDAGHMKKDCKLSSTPPDRRHGRGERRDRRRRDYRDNDRRDR